MSVESVGQMLETDFIDRNVDYIEAVVKSIQADAESFNKKAQLALKLMKKGINFGFHKGVFVEKCRAERIEKAKDAVYKKWLQDLVYEVNEVIDEDFLRNKYKKYK